MKLKRAEKEDSPWTRFTDAAKKLIFYAQQTAVARRDSLVDTGCLLIGLLEADTSFALRVLDRAGVRRDELRAQTEALLDPPRVKPKDAVKLAPDGMKSIDLTIDEARRLNNEHIGTEHLLLGVISEGRGVGARALACQDVTLDDLRSLVEQMQREGWGGANDGAPGNPVEPD